MKIALYIFGYLALLFPTLLVALNRLVDIADPPTPEISHSFWISGFGRCIWFGIAFILPALALFVLSFVVRRFLRLAGKDLHVVA